MAISAKYYVNYSASATPVEEVLGHNADSGTDGARIIHSNIDKSIGGSKEISCASSSTNVAYKDATLGSTDTATLSSVLGGQATGIDFLMITIRAAGASGVPDVIFRDGSDNSSTQKIVGVGDCFMLRPSAWNSDDYELYSSSATTLAKVDILYAMES